MRNVLAAVGVRAEPRSVANLKEAIVSTEYEPGSPSFRAGREHHLPAYRAVLTRDGSPQGCGL